MATAVCGNTGPSQQTCLKWYSQILQSFYQGVPQSGASVNTSWSLLLLNKTGDIKVQFMKFSWSTPPKVRLVYSVRDQSKMRTEAMEEGWCLLIHQLFLLLFLFLFFYFSECAPSCEIDLWSLWWYLSQLCSVWLLILQLARRWFYLFILTGQLNS